MTMNVQHLVEYEARITAPDGQPADSGGEPDGQGPPSDAAPSSVVENVLANTPASTDTRLAGIATDDNGDPVGRPPREYRVEDQIDDDTGDRVVRGRLPAASDADAQSMYDDLATEVAGADSHSIQRYRSPLGAVHTDDVQAWYEDHPDQQPTDADGEAFIPAAWDPEHHIDAESSG